MSVEEKTRGIVATPHITQLTDFRLLAGVVGILAGGHRDKTTSCAMSDRPWECNEDGRKIKQWNVMKMYAILPNTHDTTALKKILRTPSWPPDDTHHHHSQAHQVRSSTSARRPVSSWGCPEAGIWWMTHGRCRHYGGLLWGRGGGSKIEKLMKQKSANQLQPSCVVSQQSNKTYKAQASRFCSTA